MQSQSAAPNNISRDKKNMLLIMLLVIIAVLGIYHTTMESMIAIWNRSETYAHGYLILPFSLYMIWKQRAAFLAADFRPSYFPLLLLAGLGAGWLLASAANVLVVEQYAIIAMIPIIVWTLLGFSAFCTIVFPLAYLLFAVPFGEAFIPPLIEFTADFTVGAVQLTGIPIYREGNFFSLPSGNWSVVEACSGVRYLIASVTLGTLYAYLTYRSISRRLVFIAFSIIVPIIANGIRAYLIVMTGHLSDMRLAVGVDHLIYGWIFFGFVMLLLFWIGSFWREDDLIATSPTENETASEFVPSFSFTPLKSTLCIAGLVIVTAVIWPVYLNYLNNVSHTQLVSEIHVVDVTGKWETRTDKLTHWTPGYMGVPEQFIGHFRHQDKQVAVYVTYYRNQSPDHKLVSTGNVLVTDKHSGWRNVDGNRYSVALDNSAFTIQQNQLHASTERLLIWRWFWLAGGHETADPYTAKIIQGLNHVFGRGDDGAEIIIAVHYEDDPAEAVPLLQEFIEDMKPVIAESLSTVYEEQR